MKKIDHLVLAGPYEYFSLAMADTKSLLETQAYKEFKWRLVELNIGLCIRV